MMRKSSAILFSVFSSLILLLSVVSVQALFARITGGASHSPTVDLSITSYTVTPQQDWLYVEYDVHNSGPDAASNVERYVAVIDANNKVATYVNDVFGGTLASGATASFASWVYVAGLTGTYDVVIAVADTVAAEANSNDNEHTVSNFILASSGTTGGTTSTGT